jgi:hypothetical protein
VSADPGRRSPGRPAVRVDLNATSHFGQLLVTVPDPEAVAATIMAVGA